MNGEWVTHPLRASFWNQSDTCSLPAAADYTYTNSFDEMVPKYPNIELRRDISQFIDSLEDVSSSFFKHSRS